jgi:hypothetical protein
MLVLSYSRIGAIYPVPIPCRKFPVLVWSYLIQKARDISHCWPKKVLAFKLVLFWSILSKALLFLKMRDITRFKRHEVLPRAFEKVRTQSNMITPSRLSPPGGGANFCKWHQNLIKSADFALF